MVAIPVFVVGHSQSGVDYIAVLKASERDADVVGQGAVHLHGDDTLSTWILTAGGDERTRQQRQG